MPGNGGESNGLAYLEIVVKRLDFTYVTKLRWSSSFFHILSISLPACGGLLTADRGEIVSPNYPRNYDHNDFCAWEILAPEGNQIRVSVWFRNNYIVINRGFAMTSFGSHSGGKMTHMREWCATHHCLVTLLELAGVISLRLCVIFPPTWPAVIWRSSIGMRIFRIYPEFCLES